MSGSKVWPVPLGYFKVHVYVTVSVQMLVMCLRMVVRGRSYSSCADALLPLIKDGQKASFSSL